MLAQALDDPVLDAAGREADRIRDRAAGGVPVRDDREAAEAQEVGASVCVGVEAGAQPAGGRTDQQAAELAPSGRPDLIAQLGEQLADRPLEELQRDVAGEAVGDDDVGRASERSRASVLPAKLSPLDASSPYASSVS